jgi:hypothetical protein
VIYHAAFSIFGPCLKAISSMSFKLSNTYLKLFIMTAAASAMLVGSECLHRLYFDIVPLGRPWEEFLYLLTFTSILCFSRWAFTKGSSSKPPSLSDGGSSFV